MAVLQVVAVPFPPFLTPPGHPGRGGRGDTVKRVDEVVRHLHLVMQDQFTQVSKKVSNIPEENFSINIELFRHFSQVIELVRCDYISHVKLIV